MGGYPMNQFEHHQDVPRVSRDLSDVIRRIDAELALLAREFDDIGNSVDKDLAGLYKSHETRLGGGSDDALEMFKAKHRQRLIDVNPSLSGQIKISCKNKKI